MKNPPPLAISELLIVITVWEGGRKKKDILEQMTPRGSASISNFECHGWDQSVCDSKEEMKRQIINREGRREETAYL